MDELEAHAYKFMNGDLDKQITPKQALRKIQALKYLFIGDREALHQEIDRIISKVKS
ncbi:hypothetical protein [Psychrobacillus sp. FSL K6-1464]|uniref:hypothetical protein n=1 Tax=Psychrobacillus sp. FSL K6-1464 TaxID=2921545 RepID=UPI0030FCFF77